MSEPERNKEGAVTKAIIVVRRQTSTSPLPFLGSPLKGFKISFQGSISVRKIDDDANQEEKARNFDESRDVVLLRRLRKIARLEEEIRDLEVKHRLKVDELSDILED
ncbi:hypothetical protein COOONC_18574 [Cooperia oncophora]